MRRRQREPRIVDLVTHPRRYVCLRVAAHYLEVDERHLRREMDAGRLPYSILTRRRRIAVRDLAAYESAHRIDPRSTRNG